MLALLNQVQYGPVCTALLSTQLDVPIPAALPAFLGHVLARAVVNPSAETIRPVYLILSSVGCVELWALSQSLVTCLQEQLKQILCGSLPVDAHHAKMLCLAVLAKLASTEALSSYDGKNWSSTDTSCKGVEYQGDHFKPARKYFRTEKASKTLDMVATTARHALSHSCSPTDAMTLGSMMEILNLCTEIVRSVSGIEKQTWLTARRAVSKAPLDKMLRVELEASARPAVCFHAFSRRVSQRLN